MSVDVRNFLDNSGGSNFTDGVPRPPPQGEENERHSTGGHSAKSSGSSSHKSQHSGQSRGSSSGRASSSSATAAAGGGGASRSPSATPRKSHQRHQIAAAAAAAAAPATDQQQPRNGRGGGSVGADWPCDEAPLGFEPEGRSLTPQPFEAEEEGCGRGGGSSSGGGGGGLSPQPLLVSRWGESLDGLLEDADGASLFREYLDQQQSSNLFEFYFAWKYLNQLGSAAEQQKDAKTLKTLIKTMFKVYIKGDKGDRKLVTIRTELKEAIVKRMADRDFRPDIYDQVKDEVMERLRRHFYPEFLGSDLYLQFVAASAAAAAAATSAAGAGEADGGSGGKSSGSSSGSSSARGQLATSALLLPTLHEDRELDLKAAILPSDGQGSCGGAGAAAGVASSSSSSSVGALAASGAAPQTLPLTQDAIRLTERLRQDERRPYVREHDGKAVIASSLPYHTAYASSYLPISAADSEHQSLSSDALTDDTLSVTDSSVDGYPVYSNKKSLRRYHMKLSKIAQRNPDSHPQPAGFQPRTERITKVSSLAESEPAKFAEILIQRLQAIVDDDKRTEMIQSRLNAISESEAADESTSLASGVHTSSVVIGAMAPLGGGHHHATTLNQLLLAMQQQQQQGAGSGAGHAAGVAMDDDGDADAQGILDMHCKRIWEKSGQHSPSKSPHSPPQQQDAAHGASRRSATLPRSSAAASRPAAAVSGLPKGGAPGFASGSRQQPHGGGATQGLPPPGSYFAAEQSAISGAAAAAMFQREPDRAAAAALRHVHLGQPYAHHHMAGAQPHMPSSLHYQQQQQLLIGGLRQQQQQLQLPPARLSVQQHQQQVPQFSAGAAGSAFKPVVLPMQQQPVLVNAQSSQSKVIEWISRNEEVTQVSAAVIAAAGQNSSIKSISTTESPRPQRPKSSSHVKKSSPYAAMVADYSSLGAPAGAMAAAAAMPSRAATEEMAKKSDERHLTSQLAGASAAAAVSTGKPPRPAAVAQQAAAASRERGSGRAAGGAQQQQPAPQRAPAAVASAGTQQQPAQLRVAYYLNDQPIPYSTTVPTSDITLLKFKELVKELIAKKGTYRYFFKKANENELGSDVTHFFEEVTHDSTVVPKWEGKVIGYVKKVD